MKKLLLLVAFMATVAQNVLAQEKSIMLRHGDEIKQFTVYDDSGMTLQSAIDACEDGDVLYLSVGNFDGNITVNKSITIIGRGGGETMIPGTVTATANNNATITFSGIKFLSRVSCEGGANVTFKKCEMNSEAYMSGSNVNIENCQVSTLYFTKNRAYMVSAWSSVFNEVCKQTNNYNSVNDMFINCHIKNIRTNTLTGGTFRQCVIGGSDKAQPTALFSNCLFLFDDSATKMVNQSECILDSSITMADITKDLLTEKGYLGSDGTVIGIYGGIKPFIPLTSNNIITSATVVVDNEKNELNVKLKRKQ
ncbi:hypothetical protein HPS57_04485 [Prevotella sp. PINT]|uniref:hypothetical protein n=1 Tax=Palleniella intestinalis TaxID=2736291 RepID=UPI0015575E4F|nr:hypothetical protein [Palleniella intestinalis]NPD81228.1 hypothetical protein [Palleniella intestinalis]